MPPVPGQQPMPQLGQPMPQPSVGSVFSGSPIPNMASPQTPTGVSALPAF
jgi:hypothetical protein